MSPNNDRMDSKNGFLCLQSLFKSSLSHLILVIKQFQKILDVKDLSIS